MSRLISSAHALVTAIAFDGGESGKAPAEIVYLPEGSHKITPLSQKEGITVHVPAEKGEAIAAALNGGRKTGFIRRTILTNPGSGLMDSRRDTNSDRLRRWSV
jgi:hypothetical protein